MYVQDVVSRKKKNNRGSAVLEMTFLIPIFLGCIFFYIMMFLYFTETAKGMSEVSNILYQSEDKKNFSSDLVKKKGNIKEVTWKMNDNWFDIKIVIQRNGSDPLKNIRRWQLAAGGV